MENRIHAVEEMGRTATAEEKPSSDLTLKEMLTGPS
jgi:hypothetical protein